jgi:predicted dehydrogenase
MVRVGIVGCGFIGRVHSWALWALRKTGVCDLRVVAVCDEDAARARSLAEPHGADVMGLDALVSAVDAVYVCTPTAQHGSVVEAAAERGVAIYCEKPLAPNLPGAERVAELLARVPNRVGLVLRCAPVFAAIAERLDGRYGRTMSVHLRDDQFFPIRGHYASAWRAERDVAGGGTLIEHSIHDLDLFRRLCGDALDVTCRTASFFGYRGIEDSALATFTFDGGTTANLVSIWHDVMTRTSTRRVEVFCERAMMWTEDDNTGPLHVETSDEHDVVECPLPDWVKQIPLDESRRVPLGLYAEASRRFLAGETGPDAADALAAHRLVDAAYRSAEAGGRPVACQ